MLFVPIDAGQAGDEHGDMSIVNHQCGRQGLATRAEGGASEVSLATLSSDLTEESMTPRTVLWGKGFLLSPLTQLSWEPAPPASGKQHPLPSPARRWLLSRALWFPRC